ncbi:hypothetical protein LTR64_003079 [Lithohypha guttulata]|uniref:uncharacterized protein n=1 Tax=Lithohypha guttulata TaxID=1690604 RepID=UPI002DE184AE|nr:hypothetical protein LTR51_000698 [Lithohypha guttulata]
MFSGLLNDIGGMPPRTARHAAAPMDAPPMMSPQFDEHEPVVNTTNNASSGNGGGIKDEYRIPGKEPSSAIQTFTISDEDGMDISCQSRGSNFSAPDSTVLIFTHGAGGGLENPATSLFADGYAVSGPVVCFQGTMNLQSRVKAFETVLSNLQAEEPRQTFAVGGRSLGARAAAKLAQTHEEVKKLVLVSYPLISPKGDRREQLLLDLPRDKEVLFIIGSKDTMCEISDLQQVQKRMQARSTLVIVEGGDHGMNLLGLKGWEKIQAVENQRRLTGTRAAEWVLSSAPVMDGSYLVESANGKGSGMKRKSKNTELYADNGEVTGEAPQGTRSKRQKKS